MALPSEESLHALGTRGPVSLEIWASLLNFACLCGSSGSMPGRRGTRKRGREKGYTLERRPTKHPEVPGFLHLSELCL